MLWQNVCRMSSCAGDSGGPLVVKDSDTDRFVLVGVVSFGLGCGRAEYPGVYTKVEKFLPWVLEHVAKFESGVVSEHKASIVDKTTNSKTPISPQYFPTTTTTTTKTTSTTTKSTTTTTKRTTTTKKTTTPRPTSHSLAAMCHGSSRQLRCEKAGTMIKVTKAFYGRGRSDLFCPIPWYYRGADCFLRSATKDLSRACDGKSRCSVSTRPGRNKSFVRNPCSRQRPYVTVQFDCVAR